MCAMIEPRPRAGYSSVTPQPVPEAYQYFLPKIRRGTIAAISPPFDPPSPLLTKNNSSEVFVLFANGESEESWVLILLEQNSRRKKMGKILKLYYNWFR